MSADSELRAEATLLLKRLRSGDARAAEELLPLVHAELRRLARGAMASQRPSHTLQTTALLHEAWLRIAPERGADFEDREHFLAVAARAMRSVLVDHARHRAAQKGAGGRERIEIDEAVEQLERSSGDLLALDAALEELARHDAELARVVELRFFGGLHHPAIASALGLSLRRVERDWASARAWLHARLTRSLEDEACRRRASRP